MGAMADAPTHSDPLIAAFVAALDHDLRTPLQNLRMAITLLGSESAGVPERFLAPLVRTSNRLEALLLAQVGALGDLVRAPEIAPARVDAVVEAAVSQLRNERVSSISVTIDDAGPVRADAKLLANALATLLEHALTRTADGGDVTVRASAAANDALVLSVSDGGAALDADARARLFAPDGRNTPALAVAVAQRIVDRAGGKLRADEKGDRGLTLTIELARARG